MGARTEGALVWDKRDDMVVHESEPYNAEPPRGALADQVLTATDTFYSRNHGPIPRLDPTSWRLRVDGMVGGARDFSLDQLRTEFAAHTVLATLRCAGNRRAGLIEVRDIPGEDPWGPGATSTAQWSGVRLSDVLARRAEPRGCAYRLRRAGRIPVGGSPPVLRSLDTCP